MFCKAFTIPQYNNTDAHGRPFFIPSDAAHALLLSLPTGAEFLRRLQYATEQMQARRAGNNEEAETPFPRLYLHYAPSIIFIPQRPQTVILRPFPGDSESLIPNDKFLCYLMLNLCL